MKGLQCEGYSINKVNIWEKSQVNIFQIFFWGKKKSALFEIGLLYKIVSIFFFFWLLHIHGKDIFIYG